MLKGSLKCLFEFAFLALYDLLKANQFVFDSHAGCVARKIGVAHVGNIAELVDVGLQARLDVFHIGVVDIFYEPRGFPRRVVNKQNFIVSRLANVFLTCAAEALQH